MPTQGERNLELGNEAWAASFDQGHLALPPSQRYTIVTCMDARIDPAAAFGIPLGAAHVIRNAGGCVKDAFRSIVISQQLLGTREVILVKHTGCGMLTFDNETAKAVVMEKRGEVAVREIEAMDFHTFRDLETQVKKDIQWLRIKAIEENIRFSGWIYDVETGKISRIV
ncbi:carbonic anhydrase [Alternaria panax]|uniref:Carbonic anhydrase n=1 Tax=Alternaria panax TaxID=48097 RepID=A0AAD4IK58_9PLEO|nr:carbonic anhydrase [Alternaria panax]